MIPDLRCGIVAANDKLAYSEMNLTLRWRLRLGTKKDPRFLLRKALHQRRITNRFDIILLDCPPLLNTCCVNALAASDFVVIPTTLTQNSVERVPELVATLKDVSVQQVNPALQIAGIVANRTRRGQRLTEPESIQWSLMHTQVGDQFGSPVHGFETIIPESTEVRDAEDTVFAPPAPGSVLFETFQRLANELEMRLPCECRHTADASEQHEPLSAASGSHEASKRLARSV